jgi:prepilin-type N-terminal cleavage/methylation domain-containing protein
MVNLSRSLKYKKGFTLLELLIVISIIGILVTVAAASYTSSQQKARNSRRMSDMKAVQNAAEQYYSAQTSPAYPDQNNLASFGTYLPQGYPTDPKNNAPFVYTYVNQSGDTTTYCACAELEPAGSSDAGNSADSVCSWANSGRAFYCVSNLQ